MAMLNNQRVTYHTGFFFKKPMSLATQHVVNGGHGSPSSDTHLLPFLDHLVKLSWKMSRSSSYIISSTCLSFIDLLNLGIDLSASISVYQPISRTMSSKRISWIIQHAPVNSGASCFTPSSLIIVSSGNLKIRIELKNGPPLCYIANCNKTPESKSSVNPMKSP